VSNRTASGIGSGQCPVIETAQAAPHHSKGKTSMFKKILTAAVLVTTIAGASLASTGTAEAKFGQNGAFAAGAVLGLVGGSLLSGGYNGGYYGGYNGGYYEPTYYNPGYCFFKKRWVHDYYGWHKEIIKICH